LSGKIEKKVPKKYVVIKPRPAIIKTHLPQVGTSGMLNPLAIMRPPTMAMKKKRIHAKSVIV